MFSLLAGAVRVTTAALTAPWWVVEELHGRALESWNVQTVEALGWTNPPDMPRREWVLVPVPYDVMEDDVA